ncbi:MAG: DUF885 domain-containing protein, partial [Gemmatimonadota bacterium]|nr:DUF885 domain-containing protein [Gemmatimonadota bacterium]
MENESDPDGRRTRPGHLRGGSASSGGRLSGRSDSTDDHSARAHRWLDAFFQAYFSRRPVNATFMGQHDFDALLPDFSESGAGDTLSEMRHLLDHAPAAESIEDPLLSMDVRLASGFLRTQLWEYGSRHFHLGNPSLYTGEAIFGVLSLLLTEFAPFERRVERAVERLHAVPRLLSEARHNVREAPRAWSERAIRECDGALALLGDGAIILALSAGRQAGSLSRAAEVASAAFARYREHLRSALEAMSDEGVACGEEGLSLHLREGHFLTESADEVLESARAELSEATARLTEGARDFGVASPAEALAQLAEHHPSEAEYYSRYRGVWEDMRRTAIERDLLTWPDSPIRFSPQPEWVRGAAPHLYFLFYRSPAAFERPPVHEYLVTPIDESVAPERRLQLLRTTNDSVIKLNHVIHHGGIGHHVQNWHAFRSKSRIGQVAAVDCAARIALFCGGTMAEGWACYATDLMREVGALTPLEEYSELSTRVRMCARAAVDVLLHTGRLDLEGASALYVREAGMSEAAARAEAVKNSMFPGAALMYQVGTDAIHRLRREL